MYHVNESSRQKPCQPSTGFCAQKQWNESDRKNQYMLYEDKNMEFIKYHIGRRKRKRDGVKCSQQIGKATNIFELLESS